MRTKLISVSKFSRKKKSRSRSAVLVSSPVSRVCAALQPNTQNNFQKGLIFKRCASTSPGVLAVRMAPASSLCDPRGV